MAGSMQDFGNSDLD